MTPNHHYYKYTVFRLIILFLFFCSIEQVKGQCTPPLDSKKESIIKAQKPYIETFQLKKQDTIVSIGAGMMWREAQMSIITDSLFFYIEDIDTLCSNAKMFEKVKSHYEKIRGSAFTNQFQFTLGTEKSVPFLTSNIADKVIIINSFHHFTYPNEMLKECHRLLKSDGKLCISEHCSKKTGEVLRSVCAEKHQFYSEPDFIKNVEQNGYIVENIVKMSNTFRLFVFRKKE